MRSFSLLFPLMVAFALSAAAQVTFQTSVYPGISPRVQIDLNGDGAPDLIGFPGSRQPGVQFGVSVSQGNGTYAAPVFYDTLNDEIATSFAVGDFNHDGKADVAVNICAYGTPVSTPGIEVFLGRGDGTLSPPKRKIPSPYALNIGVIDVNHDGNPDLIMVNTDYSIDVMYGKGSGTFASPVKVYDALQAGWALESNLVLGDFDGDTNADAGIVGVSCINSNCQYELIALYGDGNGNFSPVTTPTTVLLTNPIAADVNQDGESDDVAYPASQPQRGSDASAKSSPRRTTAGT